MYTFTMYVSSYPFIVNLRASSLRAREGYAKHTKRLVTRDLLWLYLAVVLVAFIEDERASFTDASNVFLRTMFEVLANK